MPFQSSFREKHELTPVHFQSQSLAPAPGADLGSRPNPEKYGDGPIVALPRHVVGGAYPAWVEAQKELGIPFNPTAVSQPL